MVEADQFLIGLARPHQVEFRALDQHLGDERTRIVGAGLRRPVSARRHHREKIARFHDAVLAAGTWAVSVLGEDAEKTARWLATRGRPLTGQLDALRHHPGPLTAAPILDDALAAMECRTTAVHDGGDHSIVVGEVLAVSEPSPAGGPLLYYSSHYRRLGDGAG